MVLQKVAGLISNKGSCSIHYFLRVIVVLIMSVSPARPAASYSTSPQGQPSSMVTPMKDHNIDIYRKKASYSGNVTTPLDRPEASPLPTLHFSQISQSQLLKESVRIIHLSSNFHIKLFCPNLRELVFQCCIRVLRRPLMSSPDAPFSHVFSLRLSGFSQILFAYVLPHSAMH